MAADWEHMLFKELLTEPVRNGIYKSKEFHGHGAKIINIGDFFAHPRLRTIPMKRVELSGTEEDRFSVLGATCSSRADR